MKIHLETPRLVIRQFVETDAAAWLALDSDPEVMRYIRAAPLADEEAYRRDIVKLRERYYARGDGFGFWAGEEKGGGFIGWFCLRPALHYRYAAQAGFQEGEAELGYRLCQAAWGKGYATEGARALVRKAFDELNVSGVVAAALATNAASRRVLVKAGLRETGTFALPGYEEPVLKFGLRREEY